MENGITKLSIAGFKSIANETSLDIRPLTLLAGTNSSGKSSFMQPLLLLKQTLDAPYDPGPLRLDGANVKFTSFDQMLTIPEQQERPRVFSVTLESDQFETKLFFAKKAEQITVSCVTDAKPLLRIDSDMCPADLESRMQEYFSSIKTPNPNIDFKRLAEKTTKWKMEIERCFIDVVAFPLVRADVGGLPAVRDFRFDIFGKHIFRSILRDVIHIPGSRGNPQRIYPATGLGAFFSGTFENYTASVIAHWEENDTDKLKQLCRHLAMLGLTSKISAKRLNDAHIEVRVGRLLKNGLSQADMVNIADVGFGVSQILSILVALLVAKPGQLVYLEQPEIHLHPRAQKALAEILVEAANRGVKVVAETHSSILLLAVQTMIAKQRINPNYVALHWFQREESTGLTKVITADELDEAGRFGDWPVDFGDVELEAEGDFIDAVALTRRGR